MKTATILAVASALALASADDLPTCVSSAVLQPTLTNPDAKLCNTAMSPFALKTFDLKTDPTVTDKLCANPSCNTFLAFYTSKPFTECAVSGRNVSLLQDFVNPIKAACFQGKSPIPLCTDSQVAALSTDADAIQCSTDAQIDLKSLTTPTATYLKLMCPSTACYNFLAKWGPTIKSDCVTNGGGMYRLKTDFIDAYATTCGAVPTTAVPTTAVPTTAVPTTAVPTTAVPTTAVPTTAVPTTAVPTTAVPTTAVPTTATPTTTPCGTLPMPNNTTPAPTTATPTVTPCGTLPMPNNTTPAPTTVAPTVTPCGSLPLATTPAPTTAAPTVTPCGTLPMPTPAPTNHDLEPNYQRPMC